jgi:hypothetical protein
MRPTVDSGTGISLFKSTLYLQRRPKQTRVAEYILWPTGAHHHRQTGGIAE